MQQGSTAFEMFVAARYPSLLRSALALTGDRGHAEDLVQSALMRSYPAWRRREPDNPEAYVRTVMVRLALRWRRRRWVAEVPSDRLPEVSAADPAAAADLSLSLRSALLGLTMEHRAVLVLRHLAALSEAETAAVLGCSVGTVKSRSSRALAALRASGALDDMALEDRRDP